jgi:nucleoside-diphosphate-sugar epimerase
MTVVGDLTRPVTLEGICHGMDIVFHLGGYAHAVDQPDGESEMVNRRVTVEGTLALLEQSCRAGVNQFVFFQQREGDG